MRKIKMAIMLSAALLTGSYLQAGTVTGNFQSTANLNVTCSLSTTNINFGNITLTNTSNVITANGSIEILCSNGSGPFISLSTGNSSTVTQGNTRYMLGSNGNTDKLYYGIFRPIGYGPGSQGPGQWYNQGTGPQMYVSYLGKGIKETLPVLAKLNTNQIVTPDNYTDSIVVSVDY